MLDFMHFFLNVYIALCFILLTKQNYICDLSQTDRSKTFGAEFIRPLLSVIIRLYPAETRSSITCSYKQLKNHWVKKGEKTIYIYMAKNTCLTFNWVVVVFKFVVVTQFLVIRKPKIREHKFYCYQSYKITVQSTSKSSSFCSHRKL